MADDIAAFWARVRDNLERADDQLPPLERLGLAVALTEDPS